MSSFGDTVNGWFESGKKTVDGAYESVKNGQTMEWIKKNLGNGSFGGIAGAVVGGLLAWFGYNQFLERSVFGWLGLLLFPVGIMFGAQYANEHRWFAGGDSPQRNVAQAPSRARTVNYQQPGMYPPNYGQGMSRGYRSPVYGRPYRIGEAGPSEVEQVQLAAVSLGYLQGQPALPVASFADGTEVIPSSVPGGTQQVAQAIGADQGHGSRA